MSENEITTVTLTQSKIATIDSRDYEMISRYKWHAEIKKHGVWYAASTIRRQDGKKRILYMHTLIMGDHPHYQMDHKDHDGLNNTRGNLRLCTWRQNQWNRIGHIKTSSRYKGVCWNSGRKKWQVAIAHKYIGLYEDEKTAALVYNTKARELYGEFAFINEVN